MARPKCDICGNPNTEIRDIKLQTNWSGKIFGRGSVKICQKCISRMFRNCSTDK